MALNCPWAFKVIQWIRVRKYTRLQNTILLVLAAICFVTVWLGEGLKLRTLAHHAPSAAKHLFTIPDSRHCATAEGIKWPLAGCETRFRVRAN